MKRTIFIKSIATLTILAVTAWLWLNLSAARKAPDVAFMTITGEKILMQELSGQPLLITFWATDCPSCIREIPHLVQLHRDYAGQGLRIIAVAMFYDMPSRVVALTRAENLPYSVVLDPLAELARAFGDIRLTPTSLLIAPDGSIVMHRTGLLDFALVRSRIRRMLQQEKT
jgi:thiol-disulfide isomerase/thioredoxin